jgi:hypothetical protein
MHHKLAAASLRRKAWPRIRGRCPGSSPTRPTERRCKSDERGPLDVVALPLGETSGVRVPLIVEMALWGTWQPLDELRGQETMLVGP